MLALHDINQFQLFLFNTVGLEKHPDGGRRLCTRAKTLWTKDKNTSPNNNKSSETDDNPWSARETS